MTDTNANDDRTRTMPWSADEYVVVDGQAYVYSMHRLAVEPLIRLLGGTAATPSELRAFGHDVRLPVRWRFEP